MIKIGQYNSLIVTRLVDFGAYVAPIVNSDIKDEILLPARYITEAVEVGQELKLFVYMDSEDRPVATTECPVACVGEFAYLRVVDTNRIGAFLDWGLPKDLLCPFSEQRVRMYPDDEYLVYVYLDHNTKRIVASAKIDKFLGNVFPGYERGHKVKALVYQRTDIGYRVIVENQFYGMLYLNELTHHPEIGATIEAYVKNVREDGRIDLTIKGETADRVYTLAGQILKKLYSEDGYIPLNDNASPEAVREMFGCSKKDFKKAIGALFKQHKILLSDNGISLAADKRSNRECPKSRN